MKPQDMRFAQQKTDSPRRVLIVSPHFPPVNAPDHQRVRMSLPYLQEFGWEPSVLTVDSRYVEGFTDPNLVCTLPEDLRIKRVGAVPSRLTRPFGFGGLAYRALVPLYLAGQRLLQEARYDLVYFSTTVFLTMILGPLWKQRFGVPFVVDMQDPWLSDYYSQNNAPRPGGIFKYGFSQWLARRFEPRVMREVAHVISVSPAYPQMLRHRYPKLGANQFTVLPFGAAERDFQVMRCRAIGQSVFDSMDGLMHWTYLGRGGPDMDLALRGLFGALSGLLGHENVARLRLHFVGTNYASHGRAQQMVQPLAEEAGVGRLVAEITQRIPYMQGLALLQASDAVLVVGSDDPGYTASKIYPCILAGRPILAILHETSSAGEVIRDCRAGTVVTFASGEAPQAIAGRLRPVLLRLLEKKRADQPETDWDAFLPYTAREMTRRQCAVFDAAIA